MKALRWIANRLKDLFYDPTNGHLDVGRAMALAALAALIGGAVWNMHLKQPLDLGPTGLGGGLGAVLTAAVIYIYHDRKAPE